MLLEIKIKYAVHKCLSEVDWYLSIETLLFLCQLWRQLIDCKIKSQQDQILVYFFLCQAQFMYIISKQKFFMCLESDPKPGFSKTRIMDLHNSKYVFQYGLMKYVKGAFNSLHCQYDFMKTESAFSHSKRKEAIHVKYMNC